jgi:hypothetical protein
MFLQRLRANPLPLERYVIYGRPLSLNSLNQTIFSFQRKLCLSYERRKSTKPKATFSHFYQIQMHHWKGLKNSTIDDISIGQAQGIAQKCRFFVWKEAIFSGQYLRTKADFDPRQTTMDNMDLLLAVYFYSSSGG